MSETPVLKQKTVGILLIIFGLLLALSLGLFWHAQSSRINGFAEILPEEKTVAFVEFTPQILDRKFFAGFRAFLNADIQQIITLFTKQIGVAFLKSPSGKFLPFLLLEIKNTEEARLAAENFAKNTSQKGTIAGIFANFLVITFAQENLDVLIKPDITARNLGSSKNFIRIRQSLPGEVFVYLNPELVTPEILALISQKVPAMPKISFSLKALGAELEQKDDTITGRSLALLKENIPLGAEEAYRAKLLPFFPENPDFFLAGRNLAGQIQKIDSLISEEKHLPKLWDLAGLFSKEYLPQTILEEDVWPLLQTEFGLSISGKNALFISEARLPEIAAPIIARLRSSFASAAPELSPIEREVILKDGTRAKELVPDSSQVRVVVEKFEGVEIHEIFMGNRGIFDALVQNKWIISNDLPTLQKTILLTREPRPNLRESSLYRDMLRPIMKNPELLGIAKLPEHTFSFSKRMGSDYIETDFVLR